MKGLIDFNSVRKAIRFEAVLDHYALAVEKRGAELVGRCPFHEERKASFHVNPEKAGGVFHCFALLR